MPHFGEKQLVCLSFWEKEKRITNPEIQCMKIKIFREVMPNYECCSY